MLDDERTGRLFFFFFPLKISSFGFRPIRCCAQQSVASARMPSARDLGGGAISCQDERLDPALYCTNHAGLTGDSCSSSADPPSQACNAGSRSQDNGGGMGGTDSLVHTRRRSSGLRTREAWSVLFIAVQRAATLSSSGNEAGLPQARTGLGWPPPGLWY